MGLLARAVKTLDVHRPGTIRYREAFAAQSELHERRVRGEAGDTLILLEHPHVYTIGRRGSEADVLWDPQLRARRGVEVVETDRGGQVTYHGPGQLVGYPIIDLGPGADLVGYVRRLEDVLIASLARFGISGERDAPNTGVWVGGGKIAAIGVRVTRGVTKHGFALNVSTDLGFFAGIVPCGIMDKSVTSMAMQTSAPPSVDAAGDVVATEFARIFGYAWGAE